MKLEIDGGGYESARTAFGEGNQLGALAHQRLVAGLTATGGMAGDDSTSQEFATAYDDSAREAVTALADLIDSFAGLGRLTHATLLNHARAEARSVVGGTPVYDGGVLPDADAGYVAVLPSSPPTSLGATTSAPYGHLVGWILDHIQGFVWPNADTDRLREAGATWRAAAEGLVDLETACDQAARGFWGERSPEVPLAVDATHELRRTVRTVADQYATLAAACDTYADQVDAKRHEVIDLAEWLLEQVVEGIAISAAIGVLTGGGGAIAGGSATVARVGAEAPRFLEILTSLEALSVSSARTVRATRDALRSTRGVLVKFKEARTGRALTETSAATAAREAQLARVRATFGDPRRFDANDLRGLSRSELREILSTWPQRASTRGEGVVYKDPNNFSRQIRVMEGYPGNRPDSTTHGLYAVVSQNGDKFKIPLEGNPTL